MTRQKNNSRAILVTLLATLAIFSLVSLNVPGAASQDQIAAANQPHSNVPVWGSDVKVNPTETPEPYRSVQRNISMVANPTNPQMLLTSYDNQREDITRSSYAVSNDGGQTWEGGVFTEPWGMNQQPLGDTDIKFDRYGVGYYTGLAQGIQDGGYYVLTTTNGLDWSTPVAVVTSTNELYRYKLRFESDNSPTSPFMGRLTALWSLSSTSEPFYLGIKAGYSVDRGRTWTGEVNVSDPQWNYAFGLSTSIAPNGTVYGAWLNMQNNNFREPHSLVLDRSTDGGVTWGQDRLITGAPISPIGRPDFKGHELVLMADDICNIMRIFNFPFIAASPTDPNGNTVYAVWNDSRWDGQTLVCGDTVRHADIAFSRSTDGGVSWSAPVRINDDAQGNGVDQFQPTISVRGDGVIGVTWLDRRLDVPSHYFYDLFYAQSTDGGVTWSQNQRVSDVSNDPNPVVDYKSVDDLGYRNSLTFTTDRAIPSWIKTILGTFSGDFYIDRGLMKTPSAQSPTPPLPTSTRTPTPPPPTSTRTTIPSTSTPPTSTPTACTQLFTDVPTNHTFYNEIRCLACRGVLGGYSDGTFRPGNNITRGQIAKVVSNAALFTEPVSGQAYEDVPPTQTFYEWIQRLSTRGVMGGYPCGGVGEPCGVGNRPYFRPGANATRGQLSKIVSNAAQLTEPVSGQFYSDVPTSNPFYTEIMRLTGRGVMSGYGCGGINPQTGQGEPCDAQNRPYFRWGNNVTRGQAAKIVANTFFPACQTP